MDAGTNLDAELADLLDDLERAADGRSRCVEDGKEPVTCGVHLASAVTAQRSANARVVELDQLAPAAVSKLRGVVGRPDDVRHQDGRQETLWAPTAAWHRVSVRPLADGGNVTGTAPSTRNARMHSTARQVVLSTQ